MRYQKRYQNNGRGKMPMKPCTDGLTYVGPCPRCHRRGILPIDGGVCLLCVLMPSRVNPLVCKARDCRRYLELNNKTDYCTAHRYLAVQSSKPIAGDQLVAAEV